MKDLIRERNEKEKMERSVIKWWNVHYMTPEDLQKTEKEDLQINEILSRKDHELRELIRENKQK